MDLKAVLQELVRHKAPDLHLKVGKAPVVRVSNGDLYPIENMSALQEKDIMEVAQMITSKEKFEIFNKQHEIDFSYGLEGIGRFRVNLFQEKDGPGVAFRAIPDTIPTAEELKMPKVAYHLASKPRGLVLVTGPTGSGKSTTLASMINFINHNRRCHIITIEDPIEFIYKADKALITQREVNVHTRSFATSIRSALRQDPDVIMVGEMRDLETIAAAITLAESGHLVLSTLHTTDAPQTVDRIIDVFPSYQQEQIRTQLSVSLKGVISQTIMPMVDGQSRVVAFEVLVANDGIRHCIKEGNTHQIYSMMQIGKDQGMQTLDDALKELYHEGLITKDMAYAKAHDVDILRMAMEPQTGKHKK